MPVSPSNLELSANLLEVVKTGNINNMSGRLSAGGPDAARELSAKLRQMGINTDANGGYLKFTSSADQAQFETLRYNVNRGTISFKAAPAAKPAVPSPEAARPPAPERLATSNIPTDAPPGRAYAANTGPGFGRNQTPGVEFQTRNVTTDVLETLTRDQVEAIGSETRLVRGQNILAVDYDTPAGQKIFRALHSLGVDGATPQAAAIDGVRKTFIAIPDKNMGAFEGVQKMISTAEMRVTPAINLGKTFQRAASGGEGLGMEAANVSERGIGKIVPIVGMAVAAYCLKSGVDEIKSKMALAEKTFANDPKAMAEYKMIMGGQSAHLITGFDPTMLTHAGAEALIASQYEKFMQNHPMDPALREQLRPDSMIMRARTPEEIKFAKFYDSLPAEPTKNMPLDIADMSRIKGQILQEAIDLNGEKLKDGLLADPGKLLNQFKMGDRVDETHNDFAQAYANHMDAVGAWMNKGPKAAPDQNIKFDNPLQITVTASKPPTPGA